MLIFLFFLLTYTLEACKVSVSIAMYEPMWYLKWNLNLTRSNLHPSTKIYVHLNKLTPYTPQEIQQLQVDVNPKRIEVHPFHSSLAMAHLSNIRLMGDEGYVLLLSSNTIMLKKGVENEICKHKYPFLSIQHFIPPFTGVSPDEINLIKKLPPSLKKGREVRKILHEGFYSPLGPQKLLKEEYMNIPVQLEEYLFVSQLPSTPTQGVSPIHFHWGDDLPTPLGEKGWGSSNL